MEQNIPMFIPSPEWRAEFPGASAGALVLKHLKNLAFQRDLERVKEDQLADLRKRYTGVDRKALLQLPVLQAYGRYYRRFQKTYHVMLQLESVLKGKPVQGPSALVEAMFLAELKNLLLTAGHDLAALQLPVRLDVARGDERYMLLRGVEQELKAGDMYMADGQGIISSVLYGPDERTPITLDTQGAMITVYAPSGIEPSAVQRHLEDIRANVQAFAPRVETELLVVTAA